MSRLFSTLTMGMVALLSGQSAFALDYVFARSPAEEVREKYHLYIASEKTALERMRKYGIYELANPPNNCVKQAAFISCEVTQDFSFRFNDNILTGIVYSFHSGFTITKKENITSQERQEIIKLIQVAVDDESIANNIYEDLIKQYQNKVANNEKPKGNLSFISNVLYDGLIFEIKGNESAGLSVLTID